MKINDEFRWRKLVSMQLLTILKERSIHKNFPGTEGNLGNMSYKLVLALISSLPVVEFVIIYSADLDSLYYVYYVHCTMYVLCTLYTRRRIDSATVTRIW